MRKVFSVIMGATASLAAYLAWTKIRRPAYPTSLQEIFAALSIAGNIVLSPLTQRWYRTWGATENDHTRSLPGDNLVPEPKRQYTRAITIRASAEDVWPWLVQMGQGRGGFYTFQHLENLAGCQIHNADRIIPQFQALSAGDKVRLGPEGYLYFVVREILPLKAIVLGADPEQPGPSASWVFYLDEIGERVCRLMIRYRLDYEPTLMNFIIWRVVTEPIQFVMERGMLIGIKRRVEAMH